MFRYKDSTNKTLHRSRITGVIDKYECMQKEFEHDYGDSDAGAYFSKFLKIIKPIMIPLDWVFSFCEMERVKQADISSR